MGRVLIVGATGTKYFGANYERDGTTRVDDNGGDSPVYFPNSSDDMRIEKSHTG